MTVMQPSDQPSRPTPYQLGATPEFRSQLFEAEKRQQEAENAKVAAALAIAKAMPMVVGVLMECLQDDDPQVRLRASDILLSRALPKIAAKHAEESQDNIVDSADIASLKESILNEIKKRKLS